jgi:hypothetical protein
VLGAVRVTARYRAPAADGGLLADPPLERLGEQLAANAKRLTTSPVRIAGVPLADFRRQAVEEVIVAAREYHAEGGEPTPAPGTRLLVAGHQPDFFHPGVWVKKFALHGLASHLGYTPLNLVVDNDLVKSAALRVPVVDRDPSRVTAVSLPFDHPERERPHEEYHVRDRSLFDSFPARLSKHSRDWGFEPMAGEVWPAMAAEIDRGATLGAAASRVRRSIERRWGVTNFELPVSRLAHTRAFAGFLFAVLSDLPRFADLYNAAIQRFRSANRVRSRNHPAPELQVRGDALEAPFWVWKPGSAGRERLFVRAGGDREVMAGQTRIGCLPGDPTAFLAKWPGGFDGGWKVRPRALSFTLFVRLCLADGFIHGIGGGKYDEVTDHIIRGFFGIEPPGYAVVSATLRLPLPRFPATTETLHRAERRVRDLEWNPQRAGPVAARLPELVSRKAEVVAAAPDGKAARRQRFRNLQELTRQMRPVVAEQLASAEQTLHRTRAELAANAMLTSREYAWPLFPEAMLRDYFAQFG